MLTRQKPQLLSVSIRETSAPARVGINYIAFKLGRDRDSDDGSVMAATTQWLIGRVRQLVRKHGFPPPLGPHIIRGEVLTGAAAVHKMAVWDQVDVDRYFARPNIPPAMQLVGANDQAGAWADTLDARAASL